MPERFSVLVAVLLVACTSSPDDADPSDPVTTVGSGATGGASAGGSGGSGGSAAGGGGQGPAGENNPDGLPESVTPIYSRDYETEDPADALTSPTVAIGEWGADFGHASGGWRFQPDPITDPNPGTSEDSAGYAPGLQGGDYFPIDAHHLVTVSYMFRMSDALAQEIVTAEAFWAHDQKSLDWKYYDPSAPGGEGHRNNVHFGASDGQLRFSHVDGGAGSRIYFGPDWATLGDEWVWLCHVIDMRGAAAEERFMATYIKREGDAGVTRIGVRYESDDPPLQPYDGRGIWGFFSPIHGYWDDMVDRNGLTHDLADMHLSVDRLRVMPGWPDSANGPPF